MRVARSLAAAHNREYSRDIPPPPLSPPYPSFFFVLFLPLTSDPDSSNLAIVGTLNARNRPATRRKRISRGLYKQIAVPLLPYLCVQTTIPLVPPLVAVPKRRGSTFGTARFRLVAFSFRIEEWLGKISENG